LFPLFPLLGKISAPFFYKEPTTPFTSPVLLPQSFPSTTLCSASSPIYLWKVTQFGLHHEVGTHPRHPTNPGPPLIYLTRPFFVPGFDREKLFSRIPERLTNPVNFRRGMAASPPGTPPFFFSGSILCPRSTDKVRCNSLEVCVEPRCPS